MLSIAIWIIGVVNIGGNVFALAKCFEISESAAVNQLGQGFAQIFTGLTIQCLINIIITIIFCLAITTAYNRSEKNERKVDSIIKLFKMRHMWTLKRKITLQKSIIKTDIEKQKDYERKPNKNKNIDCKN